MKKLILILALIVLAAPCHGATYYASPSGSNTAPYDTWAKAALKPNTILSAYDLAPGDIIELDGGASGITYADTGTAVINIGTNDGGIIVRGSSESGHSGTVLIDGSVNSNHALFIPLGASGVTVQNMTLKAAGSLKKCAMVRDNSTFESVVIDGSLLGTGAGFPVDISGAITSDWSKSKILDGAYARTISIAGGATATFSNNVISGSTGGNQTHAVFVDGSSTYNSIHNLYTDFYGGAFYLNSGSIVSTNDAFMSMNRGTYPAGTATHRPFYAASGQTITLNNPYIMPGGRQPNLAYLTGGSGTIVFNIAVQYQYLRPKHHKSIGYIALTCDSQDETFVHDVAAATEASGFRMSFAVSQYETVAGWTSAESKLSALVARGHEISNHTTSHVHLADSEAFKATYSGAGANPRIVVAGTYPSLTVSAVTDSGTDVGPLDVTAAAYDTVAELRLAIDAHANWATAAATNGQAGTKSKGLKVGSTAVSTSTSIPFDIDTNFHHWQSEITDNTTWLDSVLGSGYTKTLIYPFGRAANVIDYSAGLQSWLVSNEATTKILGARTFDNTEETTPKSTMFGESMHIMGIGQVPTINLVPNITTSTEAEIRGNARAMAQWFAESNMVGALTVHETEVTATQLGYILDEFKKAQNVNVVRLRDLVSYVRESYTSAGSGAYTKALADQSDYWLTGTSPAIDAGATSTITTDRDGYGRRGFPDIGPHEYQDAMVFAGVSGKLSGTMVYDGVNNYPGSPVWKH